MEGALTPGKIMADDEQRLERPIHHDPIQAALSGHGDKLHRKVCGKNSDHKYPRKREGNFVWLQYRCLWHLANPSTI